MALKKNIVVITKLGVGVNFQPSEVCQLLTDLSFRSDDITGIIVNCYRPNQIEVTFEDRVGVKAMDLAEKIKDMELSYTVSKYTHYEESLMIYGLPFGDISLIGKEIDKSIKDFVSKIIDISPCRYHKNYRYGEFFIPNFIVVGNAKVQGKVVYSNKANMRVQQCVNCFGEGHLMHDKACKGIKCGVSTVRNMK